MNHGTCNGIIYKLFIFICVCRTSPFCLNIDEATSNNNKKVLEVLISYYSPTVVGLVIIEHLGAFELMTITTKSIHTVLFDFFTENSIPWKNLLSILMDSCAVMRGSKNGLEIKICRENQEHLLNIDGDICHHVHNACKKFCAPFKGELEKLFIDLFNDHRWSADLR